MMAAISAGASRQLTATLTAPSSAHPKKTSKYSMQFRSTKATRSPAETPASARAWLTRLARSKTSDQVSVAAPSVSMGASGVWRAQVRIMSAADRWSAGSAWPARSVLILCPLLLAVSPMALVTAPAMVLRSRSDRAGASAGRIRVARRRHLCSTARKVWR